MSDSTDAPSRSLWARCRDCGHAWEAAPYPADLAAFAQTVEANSSCPECGGEGLIARQADGVLLEPNTEQTCDGD